MVGIYNNAIYKSYKSGMALAGSLIVHAVAT